MYSKEEALKLHRDNKGKLASSSKVRLKTKKDLSLAYTPGVAEPCKEIAADKNKVYDYTMKANSVAVVTDGSVAESHLVRYPRLNPSLVCCQRTDLRLDAQGRSENFILRHGSESWFLPDQLSVVVESAQKLRTDFGSPRYVV